MRYGIISIILIVCAAIAAIIFTAIGDIGLSMRKDVLLLSEVLLDNLE